MTALLFAAAVLAQTTQLPASPAGRPVDWYMHVSTLDPGDKVILRTIEGQEIRGKVARLNGESITLRRRGGEVSVPAARVNRLDRHDGIWEGGKIGFLVGFPSGVVFMATCGDGLICDDSAEAILACGALAGGFGFGVGVLFDWITHGDHTVIQRSASRFDVAPIVTGTRKSVAVRVSF